MERHLLVKKESIRVNVFVTLTRMDVSQPKEWFLFEGDVTDGNSFLDMA
jgi:hypothetical protein